MRPTSRFHRLILILLVFLPGLLFAQRDYSREEYVICSGGPALRALEDYRGAGDRHDRFWGNFIRAARIRMDQLRTRYGAELPITWLVYRPAYETRSREDRARRPEYICDIAEIQRVALQRGVRIVWFSTKDQVIGYLNNRGGRKMSGFEFFGHSNKYCMLFDYSNDVLGVSTCYLHVTDLRRLRSGLFTSDAHVQSWGCHTGEYMSSVWKSATGHPMIGAVGKTDYTAIKDGKSLPAVGGRWTQ